MSYSKDFSPNKRVCLYGFVAKKKKMPFLSFKSINIP